MKLFFPVVAFFALLGIQTAGATGFGPPPNPPKVVSCNVVTVDPPNATTTVSLVGTIGSHAVDLTDTVPFGGWVEHEATFDISQFTTAAGPIAYNLHATWSLAPGDSPTASGTLTCHQPVPTSVSTTSTSTLVPVTTTTTATPETALQQPAPTTQPAAVAASLPRTGSNTETLAMFGLIALLAGSATLAHTRRKIR